jgi:hypothetical protein
MNAALNIIAGCFGIIGGVFWFIAAINTPTPPTGSYYGVTDSLTSPFAKAWRSGTRFNQAAAVMTGLSAFLFGLSALFKS